MRDIVLIAHNLRSSHNVGSLLRTAEGMGAAAVYMTGYTPYPEHDGDKRMPHISRKVHNAIHKTALGAEHSQPWFRSETIDPVIIELRKSGYSIYALEQHQQSTTLPDWTPSDKVAIVVGREVDGIEQSVINLCDGCLEIPMLGKKESYNVAQAAAMALYHCRFWDS